MRVGRGEFRYRAAAAGRRSGGRRSAKGGELHCNGRRRRGLARVSAELEGSFGFAVLGRGVQGKETLIRPIQSSVR
jgi:hypothetical protein